jgi:peptidoglycan/xylan/chitin deacetylase (PgdA/CDA1 family)
MPGLMILSRLFLFLLISAFACEAQQHSVALTFDDLPAAGTTKLSEVEAFNHAILKSLDRYHAPAIGFVIGQRVEEIGGTAGAAILRDWVRRGYELGNHTLSHSDFNDLTVDEFKQEVVAGETTIRAALGKAPRYFRFPDNHTGDSREKHDALAAFLAGRGYTLAVCTIDNEDYLFNRAYVKTIANQDAASAARLRAAYLAYTATEIDYYTDLHRKIFRHEIPHVMLLHVNRLNADVIEQVLNIFKQKQYRFVSLADALSDPAYKTPDTVLTKYGWMWAYRWARVLDIPVNGALETEPPAWVLKY